MPELETLAEPSDDMRKRLSLLFKGMMRSLFKEKGSEFRVEILADPAVQKFVGAHAAALDSTFTKVEMTEAMRRRLTRSNYIFSGMKAFHELNEAFPSLLDENGNRKPFERFLKDVKSIDATYNGNYLRAEYNFVAASAEMAAKWEQFMQDGDRYNLQYRTQRDDKVRPEHAALDRVTLPPSDSFWEEFYPPNGWNCFIGQTPVLTSDGWKFIRDIRRGDLVVGGSGQYRTVIATHSRLVNAELVRVVTKRSMATCTKNHRFLSARGWVVAADLKPFDILIQVGEISPAGKLVNAVHNTATLFKYLAVALCRKWKSIATKTINNDANIRQIKVDNKTANDFALLEFHSHCQNVLFNIGLRRAFGLADGAHPFGMKSARFKRVGDCLRHAFRPFERSSFLKFFRYSLYQKAVHLVLSLSDMFALHSKRMVNEGKVSPRGFSPSDISSPLSRNCFRSMSDRDAEVIEETPDCSAIDMPVGRKPSETPKLSKVSHFHGIRRPAAFNGFNSIYDFLRQTFFHTRYALVLHKDTLSRSSVQVYNLSVQDDESYIVPPGIVHNCRCTVVQVRKSKYPATNHDEAMRLGDEALQRDTKGMFRFNPGKEGKTVPDYNPYTIRRCRTCPVAKGNNGGELATFVPNNVECEACTYIRQKVEVETTRRLTREERRGINSAALTWADRHLPRILMADGSLAARLTTTTANGDILNIGKKFFCETFSKSKNSRRLAETMQLATEVGEWIDNAQYIRTEPGEHHNFDFKVYEVEFAGKRIELKAKVTDGLILYLMKLL